MLAATEAKHDPGAREVTHVKRVTDDVRVSWSLRWFAGGAALCAGSGALLYCYAVTLAPWRTYLVWLHDASGDAAVVLLGVYLVQHVQRTWPLRGDRALPWWTGLAAVGAWVIASATGVYGQWVPLERYSLIWWLHSLGSLAAVVLAGFHAVSGFRARASLANKKEKK